MDTRPRRKWVETWSKPKTQASQDPSQSQIWVGDIPSAPQPAKTQLHESRWANNANLQRQQPTVKPLPVRPNAVSYEMPKQAAGEAPDISSSDVSHGRPIQATATRDYLDARAITVSHDNPRQATANGTKESPSPSEPSKVPPHLRMLRQDVPPSCSQGNVHQSVRRPSLLTTEALNAATRVVHEEISKKDSSDDAAERATPVPTCGSPDSTVDKSMITDAEVEIPHGMVPDIRGEEPEEMIDDQDWNATRRTRPKGKKDWDLESMGSDMSGYEPPSYLTRYVDFWLETVRDFKADVLDIPDNELHDVDPVTGKLVPTIDQPRILKDADNQGVHIARLEEKLTQTSSMKIREKMGKLKRKAEKKKREEKARLMDQQESELREEMARRVNPWLCRIPAYLRPASMNDMEAVAAIYNQEVQYGWRSLDEKPVSLPAWHGILNQCRSLKLPFVVALTEYRNPHVPIEQAGHQVMGFAFLDIGSRGITGSINSTGKHSARLYVLVDPQYRRNRVGTALLDAVMSMASPSYHQKEESYQFENAENDPVYLPAHRNPREYRTILIEVCVKNLGNKDDTANGDEYQFIWNFLEGEFQTFLHSHAVSFGRCETQNPPFYLDRLIFEHQARVTSATRVTY